MKNRRTLAWVVILAIAVALTQLLVWWLRPPPGQPALVGPPRSSYELDHFSMRAFGKDGKLAFTMTAPHLARREGSNALYVNAPKYYFVGNDGSAWHGTSEYAWVSGDNSLVRLIGKVNMRRHPGGGFSAAEIHTADATIWTHDKRMASSAPTEIEEPGSILRGIGMKADFTTHSMELLSNVQGSFAPSRPAAH